MSGADSSFDVRVAASAAQLRRAYCLRIQVFGTEYGYGEDNEVDQLDYDAVPLMVARGEDVVGVLRIIPFPVTQRAKEFLTAAQVERGEKLPGAGRTEAEMQATLRAYQEVVDRDAQRVTLSGAQLGRIAIAPSFRGFKLGRRLVEAAEAWVARALTPLVDQYAEPRVEARIQLTAQSVSKSFYEHLGFEAVSDEFVLLGQPHVWFARSVHLRS